MIRVKTPSRIHLTLIDLNGNLGRIDGGVGLALQKPFVLVETKFSSKTSYPEDLDYLFEMLPFEEGFEVEILKKIPSHVGLGSETQLRLGISASLFELF
ncbi:MAG: beta-ribofuranosylaminobenzene 5'-phosphate synthase, partial [Candidatus Methanofastidiosia archaeon]